MPFDVAVLMGIWASACGESCIFGSAPITTATLIAVTLVYKETIVVSITNAQCTYRKQPPHATAHQTHTDTLKLN